MKNQKLIRFVESFILLPAVTIGSTLGNLPSAGQGIMASQAVFSQKVSETRELALSFGDSKNFELLKEKELKEKAQAIDAYFRAKGMPLAGTGAKMVLEAEQNELDWRLLAAIAARESTGGKYACKKVAHNPFGWNSCKTGFKSTEEAIEIVAKNLGGNNPKTKRHYADKSTIGILKAYNPPHIVPTYAAQVISIMDTIGPEEIEEVEA